MKNITKLTNEDLLNFFLNNKKANGFGVSVGRQGDTEDSIFIRKVIYKDKNMEIIFSYLKISPDDIIQQFTVYSNWWGKIKNSFLTVDGFKGKGVKCGVFNVNDLKDWDSGTNHAINNHNELKQVIVTDMVTLVEYCQKKYKSSPSYKVTDVISLSPNSWVRIEIVMPDGSIHYQEGINKKEAANEFAKNYKL